MKRPTTAEPLRITHGFDATSAVAYTALEPAEVISKAAEVM